MVSIVNISQSQISSFPYWLMVKNIMKTGNIEGKTKQDFFGRIETPYRLVNNKVIVPSDEEQERNPRSRSAKLRIAEKL